ncbi:hypothetical protein ACVFI8_20870 [Agarivorans sp. MS3-6]
MTKHKTPKREQQDILSFTDRLHQSGCAPYSVAHYSKKYTKNVV